MVNERKGRGVNDEREGRKEGRKEGRVMKKWLGREKQEE